MEYIILSNQFRLGELLRSETATRLNIIEQFTPNALIINNLSSLCMGILDKVKVKFPDMIITSGYRCPVLIKTLEVCPILGCKRASSRYKYVRIMPLWRF